MARRRFTRDQRADLTPGRAVEIKDGQTWIPAVVVAAPVADDVTGWEMVKVRTVVRSRYIANGQVVEASPDHVRVTS